jgi:hypothetical protein
MVALARRNWRLGQLDCAQSTRIAVISEISALDGTFGLASRAERCPVSGEKQP